VTGAVVGERVQDQNTGEVEAVCSRGTSADAAVGRRGDHLEPERVASLSLLGFLGRRPRLCVQSRQPCLLPRWLS